MLATAHSKRAAGCLGGTRCAAGLRGQGPHARADAARAGKVGLPLLTAAYKPATPQRPPLCTFAPSKPLKHHGSIP